MNNNPHNDQGFEETECLTEQQMLDYSGNKLSPRERHLVERHTLECEMCADAIEGFAMITDHSKVEETVFAVNAMISNGSAPAAKRGWWDTRMKVAASVAILVLLGSVYYFQGQMKDQTDDAFAQNFEPYPAGNSNTEKEEIKTENTGAATPEQRPAPPPSPSDVPLEQLAKLSETPSKQPESNLQEDFKSTQFDKNMTDDESPAGEGVAMNVPAVAEESESEDANKYMRKEEAAKDEVSSHNAKPSVMLDNVASTAANNNSNNNIPVSGNTGTLSNNGLVTLPSSPYTLSGTSTAPTLTQSSTLKQDYKLVTKSNDNFFALESKKTKSKSPAANRSNTEDTKGKAKKTETVARENSAGYYETTVNEGSAKQEVDKLAKADSVSADPYTQAMQKYEAGRHSEAVPLFEQTLASEPANVQALFYSSVSYLSLNKPDKAIVNLDKVLAAKNHSFADPAKWYKALAYLKKGDKTTAKTLLEQIQKENGPYKQKAVETLKDID